MQYRYACRMPHCFGKPGELFVVNGVLLVFYIFHDLCLFVRCSQMYEQYLYYSCLFVFIFIYLVFRHKKRPLHICTAVFLYHRSGFLIRQLLRKLKARYSRKGILSTFLYKNRTCIHIINKKILVINR